MTKPALLLVEDDDEIRTQLQWALAGDYDVITTGDRAAAVAAFSSRRPSATLLDLGLPPRPADPEEGLAVLAAILAIDPAAKVIVVSGQGERETALRAVGAGAFDFLCKPVAIDALKILVQRCVYVAGLEHEFRMTHHSGVPDMFEDILGNSTQMQAVFTFVRKVGPTNAPVLILGESGTGKEMVARALHIRSPRKNGPFTAINCGAIPESLLESELFGHEKGAFTGAHSQRLGQVETANGGTLFLDEIGELPAAIQVKLLRFLQEKRFQRVGGRVEIHSDTRVIAATNRALQGSVQRGEFRDDLYFRLAVVVVQVPPLRDRGRDVEIVAREFLRRYAVEHGKPALTFAPDAERAIARYTWPGNVRELQNRVHRAVIMTDGKRISASDLELRAGLPFAQQTLKEARASIERELVSDALRRHHGKITAVALELGISRPTLYELMERLHIARPV